MIIKVTQSDIARGIPNTPTSCPIARACKREFHVYDSRQEVFVARTFIQIGDKEYPLPRWATEFTIAFDSNKYVKPFEFEIDLEAPYAIGDLSHGDNF